MQDGICRSCGYSGRFTAGQQPVPPMSPKPQKQKTKGWVIALSIAGAVLLIGALIAVVLNVNRMVFRAAQDIGSRTEGLEEYGDYFDDSEDYTPSDEDPYYKEIVDSLDEDAAYTIDWLTESRYASAEDDNSGYYVTYPQLCAREDGTDYSAINGAIRRAAEQYRDVYTSYPDGITTSGYVTYMDDEKISVVFQHRLSAADGTQPRLTALNFRIATGEQLALSDLIEPDEELVMRFRAQDKTQNGGVDFVTNASDEELLKLLSDPQEAAYFYSPVGLEVGINYESEEYGKGWVSVTLKDQAL